MQKECDLEDHGESRSLSKLIADRGFWLLLAVSFLIRICGAGYWHSGAITTDNGFRFGDSDTYWFHAKRIAQGEPYQYLSEESKIFRAPFYPLFLSVFAKFATEQSVHQFWSPILAARVAGSLLGIFCVVLIAWLAYRLKGREAGLWAGWAACLYPGAVGMSVFVLSEAVFCPLMLLSLFFAFVALNAPCLKRSGLYVFFSGISTGLACLSRPSWGLWPGLWWFYLVAALAWERRRDDPSGNRQPKNEAWRAGRWIAGWLGVFCLSGIVLAMSPWWMRNYGVTGKFVPSTLQVGASLYDGWHPGATGSSDEGMDFVAKFVAEQQAADAQAVAEGKSLESTFEWRLDKRIRNAAIQWAKENPSNAIHLGLVKFIKTWRPLPVAKELGNSAIRYAEGVSYMVILIFGIMGVWATRDRMGAWLFLMPCIYFGVLHMLFIGSVRYRQPAILVLCTLAGIGLEWFMSTWQNNKERTINP